MKPFALFTALLAAIGSGSNEADGDWIARRGGESPIEAKIATVDEAGVTIERGPGQTELIRWDRVRDVQSAAFAKDVNRFKEDAEKLWRARSRLERGDAALAEPIFERLFETYRGQKHETALLVAEGLLRCRLARGANESAVIPALESIRLRREVKTAFNVYSTLRPVIDPMTSLCTALPPAWMSSSHLVKVERDLGMYDGKGDVVVAAIATLYQKSIRQQLGITAEASGRALAQEHAGVAFMGLIVQAIDTDPSVRASACQALRTDLEKRDEWAQAWSRYALGLSLLMENQPAARRAGMVELAYVPAQFNRHESYLAGMSLFYLADALEQSGEQTSATSLRAELKLSYPNHPAAAAIQSTKPAASNSQTRPSTSIVKESS